MLLLDGSESISKTDAELTASPAQPLIHAGSPAHALMPPATQATALEVIGTGIGHVVIQREAADLLAPLGSPILPALLTLVEAHRATGKEFSEHRRGDVLLRVVNAPSGLGVGMANEARIA